MRRCYLFNWAYDCYSTSLHPLHVEYSKLSDQLGAHTIENKYTLHRRHSIAGFALELVDRPGYLGNRKSRATHTLSNDEASEAVSFIATSNRCVPI